MLLLLPPGPEVDDRGQKSDPWEAGEMRLGPQGPAGVEVERIRPWACFAEEDDRTEVERRMGVVEREPPPFGVGLALAVPEATPPPPLPTPPLISSLLAPSLDVRVRGKLWYLGVGDVFESPTSFSRPLLLPPFPPPPATFDDDEAPPPEEVGGSVRGRRASPTWLGGGLG